MTDMGWLDLMFESATCEEFRAKVIADGRWANDPWILSPRRRGRVRRFLVRLSRLGTRVTQ